MSRKLIIWIGSCLGLALILISFRDKPIPGITPTSRKGREGRLQLDTVPLGALASVHDGVAAGNSRGEIRSFSFTAGELAMTSYLVCSNAISAPILEYAGCYFVGDENGVFHAFQPGVGEKWSYRTGNQITGGACLSGDLIWIGSHDHTLYAFNPADGNCRHQIECGGQINATPVFDADHRHLFLGNCDGIVRRIDLQTGKVSGELDCESPIPAQPRLVDDTLYVQTHGGELIAMDTATMTVRWKQTIRSGSVSEPFVTASFAVANVTGKSFPVFDRKTGASAGTLEADEALAPIRAGDDTALYGVTVRGVLYRWKREGENWRRTRLADFQTDCRNGCFRYGNRLLVADESGGLFYYLEDTGDAS